MNQIDVRGWAHSLSSEAGESVVKTVRGEYIMLLLLPLTVEQREIKEEYWNWIEETVLVPIKEKDPDLYSWIIERYLRQVADLVDTDLPEEATT